MKHVQINASVIISLKTLSEFLKYIDGTYAFHNYGWTKGKSGYELFAVDSVGIVYYYLVKNQNKKEIEFFEAHYMNSDPCTIPSQITMNLHTKKDEMQSENSIRIYNNIKLKYFEMWGNWEFWKEGDSISVFGISKENKLLFNIRNYPVMPQKYQTFGKFEVLVPKDSSLKVLYHHKEKIKGNYAFSLCYVCEQLNHANNPKEKL